MNTWWLWLSVSELQIELQQLEDEGREVSRLRSKFQRLIDLGNDQLGSWENQVKAQALMDQAQALPIRKDYPFDEPSDLAGIRKLRQKGTRRYSKPLSDKVIKDRIYGAWLGRCIGCLLGKPLEGTRSWDIEAFLKASGQWPLQDYVRFNVRGKARKVFDDLFGKNMLREFMLGYDKLDHMPIDDDTNYTTIGMMIVKEHGANFTPRDVATFWMNRLPINATCTAERVAYRTFAMNIAPPASAAFRNPFREWIGAQIRADAFGYVNAGNPERAADFAHRDACISHVKNGIYGEMLMAAMIAAAPYCKDMQELLKVGLSEIPKTSRLHADVSKVLAWRKEGISYEEAVDRIHKWWDETTPHHWCHTNSNAVICAVALLWGDNDFGASICRAIIPGYDTDCNGATVGSIFGMMHGADAIGKSWKDRLNNTLKTSMNGYETVKVDAIARDTFDVYRKLR